MKHVPETKIEKANRLRQRLNWKVGVENNDKNQKLKKEWIQSLLKVVVEELEVDIVEKIKNLEEK